MYGNERYARAFVLAESAGKKRKMKKKDMKKVEKKNPKHTTKHSTTAVSVPPSLPPLSSSSRILLGREKGERGSGRLGRTDNRKPCASNFAFPSVPLAPNALTLSRYLVVCLMVFPTPHS